MPGNDYYFNQIKRAVNTAPLVKPNTGMLLPNDCELFKDAPDDHLIHVNPEWERLPGQAIIHEAAEFPKLFAALAGLTGLCYHPDYINIVTQHEQQHADAAEKLGARKSLFGIELHRVSQSETDTEGVLEMNTAFHVSIDHKVTKLSLALVKGFPKQQSSGDLIHVTALGYTGIQQIGDRAVAHNRRYKHDLPIPLSYYPNNHQ